MSNSIQARLWDRRTLPKYSPPDKEMTQREFVRTIYGDPYFLNRMNLYKELKGHRGCVNTLCWSQQGDKLLSGSDDHNLNIWYPFDNDYEKKLGFNTGHRDNIFDAKFMPNTSDRIVISAAGDSEIRIFDLEAPSSSNQLCHIYTCHSDPVKRICTEAYNPYEFLTCSEDATVRHFDLRQPHVCSPHNIRSFNSGIPRHARQYASQHRTVSPRPLGQGCPKPLLDYSLYGFDINCMTINKHRPQYFVVAGMDDYMYLHDRRMIQSSTSNRNSTGINMDRSPTSQCLLRFTPSDDQLRGQARQYVTACKFSDSNGYELLGNWAGRGVYLFNIMDSSGDMDLWKTSLSEPYDKQLRHCQQWEQQRSRPVSLFTSSSPSIPPLPSLDNDPMVISDDSSSSMDDDTQTTTIPRSSNKTSAANKEHVIKALDKGELSKALELLSEHYIYLQHDGGGNESSMDSQTPQKRETTRLEHTWLHCVTAIVFARRSVRTINEYSSADLLEGNCDRLAKDDLRAAQVEILRAAEIAPRSWKGQWCLAITHWIIFCCSDVCAEIMMETSTKDSAFFLVLLCHHLQKTKKYSIGVMKLLAEAIFADQPGQDIKGGPIERLISFYITMFRLVCLMKSECKTFSSAMSGYYENMMARLDTDEGVLASSSESSSSESTQSSLGSPESPSSPESSSHDPPSPVSAMESAALASAKEQPTDWLRLLYPSCSPALTLTARNILSDGSIICGSDDDDRYIIETARDYLKSIEHGMDQDISIEDDDDIVGDEDHTNDNVDVDNEDDEDDEDDDDDDDDDDVDAHNHGNTIHEDDGIDDENEMSQTIDEADSDDDDDDDGMAYLMLAMYGRAFDRENTTEVQPSDMECHQRAIRREFESSTGVIGHTTKYTGHINTRTIKGVNFYGAQDEYVVSGSDDGRAFIWNKKTGAIVQILEADHDTVNVIQGHPFLPYLAVSGIDNTIKIFSPNIPTAFGSSSAMEQRDQIVANNRDTMNEEILEPFMTRSALENMARLYRQQYSSWLTSVAD